VQALHQSPRRQPSLGEGPAMILLLLVGLVVVIALVALVMAGQRK
jgi:hypothetical protein